MKQPTNAALGAPTVKTAYLKIVDRLVLSLPFQIPLYLLAVIRVESFRNDFVVQASFALLLLNAVARITIWLLRERVREWKLSAIKTYLLVTAFATSSAWGFATAYLIARDGITIDTFIVLVSDLGTAAAVMGVSFSIETTLAVLVMMIGPSACVFLTSSAPGFTVLGVADLVYACYLLTLTTTVRRNQLVIIEAYGSLAAKEVALQKALNESRERQEALVTMLSSIDQAYLIFDRDGLCGSDPSRKSEELFGLDPARLSIENVLRGSSFSDNELQAWMGALFEDQLPFEDVAAHGPRTLRAERTGKILQLKYHPVRSKEKGLTAIVVTASDLTRTMEAETKLSEERERAEMVLRVNERRSNFRPFLNDLELLIHQMIEWKGPDLKAMRDELYRACAGAGGFGLGSIQQWLLEAEAALTTNALGDSVAAVRAQGVTLREKLQAWKAREMNLLTQVGIFDEDSIEISRRKLARIGERIAHDAEKLQFFKALSAEIRSDEVGTILKGFETHVASFAAQHGKQIMFRVEPLAELVYLPVGAHREAFRSLIHLFSFSIGEAIESAEERRLKGKPEAATLAIHYGVREDKSGNWIRMLLSDDGRGFDLPRLRFALQAQGRTRLAELSDSDLALSVFDEAVGPFVNLAAFKASIVKAQGALSVVATDSKGTTIEVLLPEIRES